MERRNQARVTQSVAGGEPQCNCAAPEIAVLIVNATRIYREGIAVLLGAQPGVRVIGSAGGVPEALAMLANLAPDVVLLDVDMSRSLGAVSDICRLTPAAKVVAVSLEDSTERIIQCAEAGIVGFVTHDGSISDLVGTIRSATSGELPCSPRVAAAMAHRLATLARDNESEFGVRCLTAREMEVVRLIDRGMSNKEIARQLCIGVATVKNHVHNILEKLHVRRRSQAAALVRGMLPEL